MSDLVIRRLLIDLNTPFPARWNGGDAFLSALFNALSMSFPVGEQYFIDSVRNGLKSLPEDQRARFETEVQGFIGQEATHRRIHALFNDNLTKLGFTNAIARRASVRLARHANQDVRIHVAATAATEHFTAIFSGWILRHPEVLDRAEPRLQTLWRWHCAEEAEHRCTAFDIYNAISGDHTWRIRVFRYITVIFFLDVLNQTVRNLWHDGSLFKWSTWRSGYKILFAKDSLLRGNYQLWRDYFSPDFHPSQHEANLALQWLQDNNTQFVPVG